MKHLEVDIRHSWSMRSKLGKHLQKKLHKCRVQPCLHYIVKHFMHLEESIESNPRQGLALLQEKYIFTNPSSYSSLLVSSTVTLTIGSKHKGSGKLHSYVNCYIIWAVFQGLEYTYCSQTDQKALTFSSCLISNRCMETFIFQPR